MKYKTRQKNNHGRIIPFEALVPGLYRADAFCQCFITSEDRVHAWVSVIADELYKENTDEQYTIIWKDTYVKGDKHPMSTEFIVRDNIHTCKEDDFLFKVIIYLTTGKIMTQGKGYGKWCKEHFQNCLDRVNEYSVSTILNDSTETILKSNTEPDSKVKRGAEKAKKSPGLGSDKESEETAVKEIIDSEQPKSAHIDDNEACDESETDEHIDIRMDVFEDKLLEISDKLSQILSHRENKVDKLLSKVNTLEENILVVKDKKEILQAFKSKFETKAVEKSQCNISDHLQLEKKLKEITTEMEKKKSQHSNEVSTLKNKIKALEKDNSELHHRCEKLEMSI